MKFSDAIDAYVRDMQTEGKLRTASSERAYRDCLNVHADDCAWTDPRHTARGDCKRTLARWANPNTQRTRRAVLVSFYDWLVEEGERADNPARQTRKPKAKPARVFRFTLDETVRFLEAAHSRRERWVAFLGVCAGVRREELRLLQGRHFSRAGFVWVSPDIGKGGRERYVPIISDLAPIVAEIQEHCGHDDYVIGPEQFADPGWLGNSRPVERKDRPGDGKTIWRIVRRIGRRANIAGECGPHAMRRAFADYITRGAGVRNAQLMLGHADLSTTQRYLSLPQLDELAAAVRDIRILPGANPGQMPLVETVGIEPTLPPFRDLERVLADLHRSPLLRRAALVDMPDLAAAQLGALR